MTDPPTAIDPPRDDARDGLLAPPRRALTIGLVLTITLVASEALAIGTVMPLVADELGDKTLYGWVFTAFFLGSLIGIVLVGGLIDRGGLRRPLALGLGLFATGLLIGGLAPSMPVLIVGRFIQGLGFGAVPPTAYVAIARTLPDRLRPRMFAVLSTAWVIPGLIGPAIAGLIGETVGWRWVFLGLLPLIAIAGAITLRAIATVPHGAPSEHQSAEARRRAPLALLLALGVGILMAGLTSGEPVLIAGLAVLGAAIALPAFIRLVPTGTLRLARGLPAAVGLRGILTFGFFAADAYVSLLLIDVKGTSAIEAGVVLTSATLTWTGGAWVQARFLGRFGARRFVGVGFATVAIGLGTTIAVLAPGIPWELAIVTWGIAGFGMGLSYSPLSIVVLREAPPETQGAATSGLQLSDTIGTALGAGLGGALIAAAIRSGAPEANGVAATFTLGTVVLALGAIASTRLGRRPAPATTGVPLDEEQVPVARAG